MTMGQSAEPAEEIAEGHGAEISSDPDWKTRRTQFTPSPQYQQGPTSTHTKKQQQAARGPQKQRPHFGPECSPQNGWTHCGSTRFAGSIRAPKVGPSFWPVPMSTLGKHNGPKLINPHQKIT